VLQAFHRKADEPQNSRTTNEMLGKPRGDAITLQQRQPSNSPRDLFSMVAQQDNDSHPRVDWKQALAILFRLEKR